MLGALVGGLIGGALGASSGGGSHTVHKTETRTIVEREKIDYKRLAEELVNAFKEDLVAPWRAELDRKKMRLENMWKVCSKCGNEIKVERIYCRLRGYAVLTSCGCEDGHYRTVIGDYEWRSEYAENRISYEAKPVPELTLSDLCNSHDGAYAYVWKEILKHYKTEADENSPLVREIKDLEEKIANPYPHIGLQPLQQVLVAPLLEKGLENIAEPSI